MTAYFDDLRREVSDIPRDLRKDEWIARLAEIEERAVRDVTLVSGDREFPDDLRERIMGTIAMEAVCRHGVEPRPEAVDMAWAVRISSLCEGLHSLFHEVASRRIRTRFGLLSDSPRSILRSRENHDGG